MFKASDPWIKDAIENLAVANQIMVSGFASKTRIAYILIDNAAEIVLRCYLKLNMEKLNLSPSQIDNLKFYELTQKVSAIDPNIANVVNELLSYHYIRNKLYHVASGLLVRNEMVEKYKQLVVSTLNKLYQIPVEEIRESISESTKLIIEGMFALAWQIKYPSSLPNPFDNETKMLTLFSIEFEVENKRGVDADVMIYVASHSQAIAFKPSKPYKKWTLKRFIPAKEEVDLTLDDVISQRVAAYGKEIFRFRGLYRKIHAIQEFIRRFLVIEYRISARYLDGLQLDSGIKRLEIEMEGD